MKKNILLLLLILLGINPTFCMKRKRPLNDDSGEERKRRKVANYSDDLGYKLLKELLGVSDSEKKEVAQEEDELCGQYKQDDGWFYCPHCEKSFEEASFLQKHIPQVHEKPEFYERVECKEQCSWPDSGFFRIRDVATNQVFEQQLPMPMGKPITIERRGVFSFTRLASLVEEGEDAIWYVLFAMVCLGRDDNGKNMIGDKKLFSSLKNNWEKERSSGQISSMEGLMVKDPFFEPLINKDGNPAENISMIYDLSACEQALQAALVDEYEIGSDQIDRSKMKFVNSHFTWNARKEILQNICCFRSYSKAQVISFRTAHGMFVCKLFYKNGQDHILMLPPNNMISDDVLKGLAKRIYFLFKVDPIPEYVLAGFLSPSGKKKDGLPVAKKKTSKGSCSDYLGEDGLYRCPAPCNFETRNGITFGNHLVNKVHGYIKVGDRAWDIYLDSERTIFICPVCNERYRVEQYATFVNHMQTNHCGFGCGDDVKRRRTEHPVVKKRRKKIRGFTSGSYRGTDGIYRCPCGYTSKNQKTFGAHLFEKAHGHVRVGDRILDKYLDFKREVFNCPECDKTYRLHQYSAFRSHLRQKHKNRKKK